MNQRRFYSLDESLSDAGALLVNRDLKAEREAGKISIDEYLHLVQEQRLTRARRDVRAVIDRYRPVQFDRPIDEGLL